MGIISIKIKGNPLRQGTGGYGPIFTLNAANFDWTQTTNDGGMFAMCDFYFMFRTEADRIIYVLKKNKIKTQNDGNVACFEIGISIPRGEEIASGNPYALLKEIWNELLFNNYIREEGAGIYRYEKIDFNTPELAKLLENILSRYPLRGYRGAYRPMSPEGRIGYMQLIDTQIEDLFADVHYKELQAYREVLVGTSLIGEIGIQGLTIPREPLYEILCPGTSIMPKKANERVFLPFADSVDLDCYDVDAPYDFIVGEVVEGRCSDSRVSFNLAEERITLKKLEKRPKTMRVRVDFNPDKYENKCIQDKGFQLRITKSNGITISKNVENGYIILEGDEINPRRIDCNYLGFDTEIKEARCITCKIESKDRISINLDITTTTVKPEQQRRNSGDSWIKDDYEDSTVKVPLKIQLSELQKKCNDGCKVIVTGKNKQGDLSYVQSFNPKIQKNGEVEVTLGYVFKKITRVDVELVCFNTNKKGKVQESYYEKKDCPVKSPIKFEIDDEKTQSNDARNLLWIIISVAALLLGGGIGYATCHFLKSAEITKLKEDLRKASKGTGNTSTVERYDNIQEKISEYENVLNNQNLEFAKVEEIYNWVIEQNIGKDEKFYKKIEAYHKVCEQLSMHYISKEGGAMKLYKQYQTEFYQCHKDIMEGLELKAANFETGNSSSFKEIKEKKEKTSSTDDTLSNKLKEGL